MLYEHPLMDLLDFTYSSFGAPKVEGHNLRVPVHEFSVSKHFPNFRYETIFNDGFVILKNVQSSKREISEYENEEKQDFRPSYLIEDGPFPEVVENLTLYEFDLSGSSYDPPGYVEWLVLAESIGIEGGTIRKVFE